MTVGFSTFLNFGFSVYYTPSLKPKDVLSIMREKQVEFMIVVPAFLKLLKTGIEAELNNSPKSVKAAFNIMFKLAKFIPSYRIKKLMFKKFMQNSAVIFQAVSPAVLLLMLQSANF